MMLGEKVAAEEAERIGMIYKIFPDETFVENSMSIASYLSQMPTKGLAHTKQLLSNSVKATLEEQLQDEDIYNCRQYCSSFHPDASKHPKLVLEYKK